MSRRLDIRAAIDDRRARYNVLALGTRPVSRLANSQVPARVRLVTNGEVTNETMRTFFHCVENDLSWVVQAFRVLTRTTSALAQIDRSPAR